MCGENRQLIKKLILFIYLFMAALAAHKGFLSGGERGLLSSGDSQASRCGLLLQTRGLEHAGFSSSGAQT